MANHKSALKRIKQTKTKTALNKYKHKTAKLNKLRQKLLLINISTKLLEMLLGI